MKHWYNPINQALLHEFETVVPADLSQFIIKSETVADKEPWCLECVITKGKASKGVK